MEFLFSDGGNLRFDKCMICCGLSKKLLSQAIIGKMLLWNSSEKM